MNVAKKIRRFMERNGITQDHVCQRTGIPALKLELMLQEERKLTFEEYELICGALGVGMAELLEATPPRGK